MEEEKLVEILQYFPIDRGDEVIEMLERYKIHFALIPGGGSDYSEGGFDYGSNRVFVFQKDVDRIFRLANAKVNDIPLAETEPDSEEGDIMIQSFLLIILVLLFILLFIPWIC